MTWHEIPILRFHASREFNGETYVAGEEIHEEEEEECFR